MALRTLDVADGFASASVPSDVPLPTGAATQVTLAAILAELLLKADLLDTQPVSIASMPTTPVTGTFFQATQPVSIAAPVTATLSAETTKVIGTVNNVASIGRTKVAQLYNDYTSVSVTTGAYVQLTASTASVVNRLEVFDSSGEALILAVGAATSEVDQFYIFPGGNGIVDLAIPASSRISIKAKTNTANVGFIAVNLYS